MSHVYFFWRGTQPLYVGCTNNLRRRMKEHHEYRAFTREATHISVIPFDDHEEALRAETHYIGKLRPVNNIRGNPAHRLVADRLACLEYDVPWFHEQPRWMQDLVNDRLGIGPAEAVARKRQALRDLRWGWAA